MEREEYYLLKKDHLSHLLQNQQYKEAQEEMEKRLRLNPDQPALKITLADIYLKQGRLAPAKIILEEILATDPQNERALSLLGDVFLKEQKPQEALSCYRQAFLRTPREYFLLQAARALKKMNRYEEALGELDKVLVPKPQHLTFLKEKALILTRLKRYDQALVIYEKIKELTPADNFVQKEILRLRSQQKPKTQVLKDLQLVVGMESKKDDAQMHGLLAQKLKDAGLIREAIAEYKIAATLDPHNPYFLKQQGFCHYRQKEYDLASQFLQEALRKDPTDIIVRKTLHKLFTTTGQLEKFLILLEGIVQEHPEQISLWGTIKSLRKKLGKNKE
ncbi:MAG: tetratricopeptide repeat protein [Thermodesulfobacteriota bacterium]